MAEAAAARGCRFLAQRDPCCDDLIYFAHNSVARTISCVRSHVMCRAQVSSGFSPSGACCVTGEPHRHCDQFFQPHTGVVKSLIS